MKKYFKYEKLSKNIKDEIQNFCENLKEDNIDLDLENAAQKWFDEKFEEWFIEQTDSAGNGERRKNVRCDIELPVKIVETLIESSANEADLNEINGIVTNFSRGGLCFSSNANIPVSSIIKVLIDLSKVDPGLSTVDALAMVIRSEQIDGKNYSIGVAFSSINENSKSDMDFFIFKNLAHHFHTV